METPPYVIRPQGQGSDRIPYLSGLDLDLRIWVGHQISEKSENLEI